MEQIVSSAGVSTLGLANSKLKLQDLNANMSTLGLANSKLKLQDLNAIPSPEQKYL